MPQSPGPPKRDESYGARKLRADNQLANDVRAGKALGFASETDRTAAKDADAYRSQRRANEGGKRDFSSDAQALREALGYAQATKHPKAEAIANDLADKYRAHRSVLQRALQKP